MSVTLLVNFYCFEGGYGARIDETISCTICYRVGKPITTFDPYETSPRYELTITRIESEKELPALTLPITGQIVDCGSGVISLIAINLGTMTVAARCASKRYHNSLQTQIARKPVLETKWVAALMA